MPWPEFEKETQSIELAGKNYPVSRVIVEQKDRFIDFAGSSVMISVWELIKDQNQRNNPAFVKFQDGKWIEGFTKQRRWPGIGGRPERQTIFYSHDRLLSFVINSIQITV